MLELLRIVRGWIIRLILAVLASGPVPHHVGFVMDGNRRYARMHGRKVLDGHGQGLESLKGVLDMCLRLGVHTVSVYAFAIDNFARPKDEVQGLMDMAHGSLLKLCGKGQLLSEHSVKVNFIGRTDLLPASVQETVRQIEDMTRNHERLILNICSPYSSRDEVTSAVRTTVERVYSGELEERDITEGEIQNALQAGKLDLLIRTSDVHRLSDFLLWQTSNDTQIHFVKAYWPEFGVREMLSVMLRWQRKHWIERYWDSG